MTTSAVTGTVLHWLSKGHIYFRIKRFWELSDDISDFIAVMPNNVTSWQWIKCREELQISVAKSVNNVKLDI